MLPFWNTVFNSRRQEMGFCGGNPRKARDIWAVEELESPDGKADCVAFLYDYYSLLDDC